MTMNTNIFLNFGFSALALIICLTALWLMSLKIRDASIIDIFWGTGFGIVALVCLYLAPVKTPYLWLLAGLPIIWAIRLSLYLAKRNLGHGEDPRYISMQKRAAKKGMDEMSWRRRAFFTIFLGQGLLIMIVSAPIWWSMAAGHYYHPESHATLAYQPHVTAISLLSILGAVLWLIGFL